MNRRYLLLLLTVGVLFGYTTAGFAQNTTIHGEITDARTGDTLPGVNILVKGTTTGTSTDSEGNYEFTVPSLQDTLVISFIGYETQEVPINGQTNIDITLDPQAIMGEEMVVVGYGEQQRNDLTGSVESINTEDLPTSSAKNLTEVLSGRVAGLNLTGGNSSAGDQASLQVRGQNTLSAGSSPLIVVDDIIFHGSLNDINMADVENINVLKDASAAAIYGAQAANGVVIITTKDGGSGEPTINFNSYVGVQDHTNHPVDYMNGQEYAERLVNYQYIADLYNWYDTNPTGPEDNGGRPAYPDISDPDVVTSYLKSQEEVEHYLAGDEVDWMNEITRTAPVQNYNLNVSGGTENMNYYVSGSHTVEKGVLKNDDFTRNTLATKVNADVTDWMTVGVNSSYSNRDYSGISASLNSAETVTPLASVVDENGNYPTRYNSESFMAHPLRYNLIDNKDVRNYFSIKPHAEIEIPPIEGLSLDLNYSYNLNTRTNKTSRPDEVQEALATGGEVEASNFEETNTLINSIAHYDRDFARDHSVNLTLLFSREQREGESSSLYAERFDNQSLGYNAPSFGQNSTVGGGAYEETSLAYMTRLNYGFKDKYLLTGTIRRDGYSGFGSNNKYATFRSISTAWVMSNERFMSGIDSEDLLKLRISYGENGNQGVGRYASLQRLSTAAYVHGSTRTIGLFASSLGNSNLSWETTSSLNVGVDYSFLKSRLSGTVDLYTSQTKDVLVRRTLPGATGYQNVWTNIGAIDNKGIDVSLSTVNVKGSLRWESNFIFSLNRDKLSKLYGDGEDDIGNQWFVGEPISAIYDYKRTGELWTEEDLYNGDIDKGFYPGQFKLEDLNNDGEITAGADRTIVGYGKPNYRFSISNSLYYGNFSLSFLLRSIQGGSDYFIRNNRELLEASSDFDYAQRVNQPAVREYWTPFNGVTNAPAVYNYPSVESGHYQNRSFIRLQNVSLRYNFDKSILTSVGVKGLQVYVNGKNLYTWTNWSGYDPELASQNALMMRSITAGVDLSF
ncbi:SusC/RagA family TonB-linked outer membrane protein [Fodinibius roseus]|nr:SusC/RagA family TonB-linked outer membrane protein [Fodinibius roseus]